MVYTYMVCVTAHHPQVGTSTQDLLGLAAPPILPCPSFLLSSHPAANPSPSPNPAPAPAQPQPSQPQPSLSPAPAFSPNRHCQPPLSPRWTRPATSECQAATAAATAAAAALLLPATIECQAAAAAATAYLVHKVGPLEARHQGNQLLLLQLPTWSTRLVPLKPAIRALSCCCCNCLPGPQGWLP